MVDVAARVESAASSPGGVWRGLWVVAYRDLLRFLGDKAHWSMALSMPLMTLVIFGAGFNRLVGDALGSVSFLAFVFPGIIAMTVLMESLNSGLSVVQDREFGFLKEVLVAPLSRQGVVFGKALGGSVIAVMQGLLLIVLTPFLGIDVDPASIPLLVGVLVVVCLSLSAMGILIASGMRRQRSFHLLLQLIVFPLTFLSGMFFPLGAVPPWLRVVTTLNPVTYGVDAIRQVFLADDLAAADGRISIGLDILGHRMTLLEDILVVAAVGAVFMIAAVRTFGRRE